MQLFDLSGKVALVTGGNGGIGKGIALGLAQAGAAIAVVARDEAKTAEAVAEIRALGVPAAGIVADVAHAGDLERAVEEAESELGTVTILVNNAGVGVRERPETLTDDGWDTAMETNLRSAWRLAKLCYPEMKAAGGGKIINVASLYSFAGQVTPAYSVSKGGLLQLTRSLANAWAGDNIQVNAIIPGYIQTGLTARIQPGSEIYDTLISRTPAARPGVPEDLAGAAVFLASGASSFVTGHALVVDGGLSVADVAVRFPLPN
ncbi:MAG: SDR family NAD(P)-dependent oxidoreductase [Dehalococcoidia bacterium]